MHWCEVLDSNEAVEHAIKRLGWHHPVRWKTWDLLKAATYLGEHLTSRSRILDAGCSGSLLLELMSHAGYRSLYGCDLVKKELQAARGLRFRQCDLTRTPYRPAFFDAVACVSVIEHGVPFHAFFAEMSRILRPGGHLVASCDYCEPKVTTEDISREQSLGLPWTIFSRAELASLLSVSHRHGFQLVDEMRWDLLHPPVEWAGKRYTFAFVAMRLQA